MRYFAVVMLLAVVVTGCATAAPETVNVTGLWTGSWAGHGVFPMTREDVASLRLTQQDRGVGSGRFWIDGAIAAESVPLVIRLAGLTGVPVFFEVHGNQLVLRDSRSDQPLAEFTVTGDRMVGRPLSSDFSGRIVLQRAPERVAVAPPAQAPPPPAVAAPPPPPPPAEVPAAPPAPIATARPSPKEFRPAEELRPVYFGFDRWTIDPSEAVVLDTNARWLQANRDVLVLVEGHCDERGTDEYNLALGDRRAKAVRDYLVGKGVAADRVTTLSQGEQQPVCRESNEACWRKNRRAVLAVKPK